MVFDQRASDARDQADGIMTGHETHAASKSMSLEILNFVEVIRHFLPEGPLSHFLHRFENEIFQVIVLLILGLVFYLASKRSALIPGRLQSVCESVIEGLSGFVTGVLGPHGKKHTPFVGTLFLYVLSMNILGLFPLMKAPTSSSMTFKAGLISIPIPTVTVALALLVFLYVQWTGIRNQGVLGYLDHMAGNPRDIIGIVMSPLMFVIHIIGELAKPFSLAFRLFCNIMAEDVLIAVFIGLSIVAAFIPLQSPFLIFALLTSSIQAFVFMLLSTVYLAMVTPHEEEHGRHESAH